MMLARIFDRLCPDTRGETARLVHQLDQRAFLTYSQQQQKGVR